MLLRWLINAVAIYAAAYFLEGIEVQGVFPLLLAAALLGLINPVIRPVLVLLTLPLNLMTLGLFTFVLNALLFWLTGALVKGLVIENFVAALFGSLLISVVSLILSAAIR